MFVCVCALFFGIAQMLMGGTVNTSQGRILRNMGREHMEHNFGLLQIILVSLMSCVG